jgi:hypothetical protein
VPEGKWSGVRARRVVAGTVANNVRWVAALESACTPQGGTVNLLHVEKTSVQNYERNFGKILQIKQPAK